MLAQVQLQEMQLSPCFNSTHQLRCWQHRALGKAKCGWVVSRGRSR